MFIKKQFEDDCSGGDLSWWRPSRGRWPAWRPGQDASARGRGQSSVGKRTAGLVVDAVGALGDVFTPAMQADDESGAALCRRLELEAKVFLARCGRDGRFFSRRVVRGHGFSSAGRCANTGPMFSHRAASRLCKCIRSKHQKDNAPEQQTHRHAQCQREGQIQW